MRQDKEKRLARFYQLQIEHPEWGRRPINKALRAEFGKGGGFQNATVDKLTAPARTARREAKQAEYAKRLSYIEPTVAKAPRFKTRRQGRYDYLRNAGFDHEEARVLSVIRNVKNNYAFKGGGDQKGMIAERRALKERFLAKATREGWGKSKERREWVNTIWNWYKANGLIFTDKDNKDYKSPWDWFHKVNSKLPPDLQADYPRSRQYKIRKPVTVSKLQYSDWIRNLREKVRKDFDSDNPSAKRRAEWRGVIDKYQAAIRRLNNGR